MLQREKLESLECIIYFNNFIFRFSYNFKCVCVCVCVCVCANLFLWWLCILDYFSRQIIRKQFYGLTNVFMWVCVCVHCPCVSVTNLYLWWFCILDYFIPRVENGQKSFSKSKTTQNTHGQKWSRTLPTMQKTSTMQNNHALSHTHIREYIWETKKKTALL